MSTEPDGPVVQLRGDLRTNSRELGLPVVDDDGYTHLPECWWCNGEGTNDTCRRSIRLREHAARFSGPAWDDAPAAVQSAKEDGK